MRLHIFLLTYCEKHYIISLKEVITVGIGSILAELLKAKNMNVAELANQAKVPPSTLYSIIKRDNLKVDIDVLIKISEILGVNTDYFYDRRTPYNFSLSEIELIKKYRQLDADGKQRIENQLNFEVEQLKDKESAPSGAQVS